MTDQYLDNYVRDLQAAVRADGAGFELRFGRTAREFLDALPAVFQLLRRTSLDLALPIDARRIAAQGALYLAEAHDFLPNASAGVAGHVDDCFAAFRALLQVLERVPEGALEKHWRGEASAADAFALAHNVQTLDAHVPAGVRDLVIALFPA